MLARFATGASFSTDSKGGGRESNSRFLPFMIQMARHLLDQGNPSQRRSMAKSVSTYITSSTSDPKQPSPPSGTQPTPSTEETVQFMMVNSLLSESYESWLEHRRAFLQRGIYHAYMQHHSRSSNPTAVVKISESEAGSTDNNLLSILQTMLVYTGLIEQLQRFLKVKRSGNPEGSSSKEVIGEDESESLEAWEVVMKERLLNVREMVGFSKELLSWLENMTSVSDLQEAFDVIGVLGDVISGGFTRCEEFVQAAINAGKS